VIVGATGVSAGVAAGATVVAGVSGILRRIKNLEF
jgi:hypothetical protein